MARNLTLWEAMEQVLQAKGKPMSPDDIADEIKKRSLYRKRDGTFADSWQITMRAHHKPERFEITISLRK